MHAVITWFSEIDWLFRHTFLLAALGLALAAWLVWHAHRLARHNRLRWVWASLAVLSLTSTATGIWLVNGPLHCVKNAYGQIGQKPADFAFQLVSSDAERRLKDYRGKIVVVNVWPAQTMLCRSEQATLDRLNQRYSNKGLVVITLSDQQPARLRRHFTEQPASFVEGRLATQHVQQPLVQGLERVQPVTFILDRGGVVRASLLGARSYDELEEKLTAFL